MNKKRNINKFMLISTVILMTVLLSACIVRGDELPVLKTKPKAVIIFKNGLGFFVREGTVSFNNRWALTEEVPSATLGSLWIGSSDCELEEVIAFKEDVKKQEEAVSIAELLSANTGKKVVIKYGEEIIEGTIKSVPENREGEVIDPYSSYPLETAQATAVIISTASGDVVLNKSSITNIKFPEGCNSNFFDKEKIKKLKFKSAGDNSTGHIKLSYLQKGITWAPSYLVDIENEDKARIIMKATVVNDIEDLEDVEVFFVVGYPNFMFANMLSPMTLDENITQFIQSLNRGGSDYDAFSNVMTQSVTFNVPGESDVSEYGYTVSEDISSSSEEDLFLYNKKGLTLKKGERGYYIITSADVDCRHIYEWKIPDTMEQNKELEQVWHSIKLVNSTGSPWTTAPAFVVNGEKPISQDIINYTPPGTDTNLKLTVATDIKTDRKEFEADRERDVKIVDNYYHYDLVTVQGELYIKNSKNKDVTLEIEKKLKGDVIEASHKGKTTKVAQGLEGVNFNSVINWEIPVKSGEKIKVTYKYKVYISQ